MAPTLACVRGTGAHDGEVGFWAPVGLKERNTDVEFETQAASATGVDRVAPWNADARRPVFCLPRDPRRPGQTGELLSNRAEIDVKGFEAWPLAVRNNPSRRRNWRAPGLTA